MCLSYAFFLNSGKANKIVFISTGTTSTSVEHSKSDPSMSNILNGSKKSADINKKQTEVMPTQDSNGTDVNHSPSVSSAGMCTPISIVTNTSFFYLMY